MVSNKTAIEWTDKTWNPTTGCHKVSPGCLHCYAEAITERFTQTFVHGFNFTVYKERLEQPKHWLKPSRIFVNSMSDLFHEEMPFEFLQKVFKVMEQTPWHIYQILTKRHQRLEELGPLLTWPENIWLGVSVENQDYVKRIDYLRQVPAQVRFLSCEPLLSNLTLDLTDIDWVIVGGESGQKHRPLKQEWVENIMRQCEESEVAFFFKQWGGRHSKAGGRLLNEKTYDEMPDAWYQHLAKWQKSPKKYA